jgi:RimJ/RimL family protein N-acetyltransferase
MSQHDPVDPVRLVRFDASHLAAFRETMLGEPEVARFTRFPVPVPEGWAQGWFGRYEQGWADGTMALFAITGDADEFLGFCMAVGIDRESATCELGYATMPATRGRGVATAALRLLSDWAFAELAMLRLELHISAGNEASRIVAERAGFVYEGTLRSAYFKQGLREDTEIWSRLPTDA